MTLTVVLLVSFRGVHLSHVNLGTRLLKAVQVKVTSSPTVAVALFRRCFWMTAFRWTGAGENDLPSFRPEKVKFKCKKSIVILFAREKGR